MYISDYRRELEQVAKKLNVTHMSTNGWGASGQAERPSIYISVKLKRDSERVREEFVSELEKLNEDTYLFNISAESVFGVMSRSRPFYVDGKWTGDVS